MNKCSQSLPQSGISSDSNLLAPMSKIDIPPNMSSHLPLEIWGKIFSNLAFNDLKLFTEYKIQVLKKPLDGNEDVNRLMVGKQFIFYKKDFLNDEETRGYCIKGRT